MAKPPPIPPHGHGAGIGAGGISTVTAFVVAAVVACTDAVTRLSEVGHRAITGVAAVDGVGLGRHALISSAHQASATASDAMWR